ncbi:MAG TPA: CBS domain-containing protein [Candidatus Acidoferrales bacterium]|nr:CBS domain-containing protein [Candidatus Acidoferrales bacterium]
MIVSMWMSREIVSIGPDRPIAEAAELMARRRIRRLLVVTPQQGEQQLLGIVSATDILHAYPPEINPFAVLVRKSPAELTAVREIMKSNVITVTPDTPIEEAAQLMRDRKVGAFPVLRDGKLVGIITESDIFRAFTSIFSAPEAGVRITFVIEKREDAFNLVADIAAKHAVHVLSLITSVQGDTPVCVVRLAGPGVETMLEALWKSEHRVLNVVRLG